MQADAANIVAAAQAGVRQASALAVAYSFSILGAIVLLIAGLIVAGVAERWSYAVLGHVHGFDKTLRLFLSKVLRYGILILVAITVLAQFGVQTASIIATLGAAGLAIGLALQGTLQNIAAGIMLLVLRPFRVGESIEVGSVSGTVQEIGLFATELRTGDGLYVLAPNSQLWNTPVTNYSRNATRQYDLTIGIGHDDDVELAERILLSLAAADGRVLRQPAPGAFVSKIGDSAIAVTLRYWTGTADWWSAQLALTKAAKRELTRQGISIPYPQQDVHVISAADAASLGGQKADDARRIRGESRN